MAQHPHLGVDIGRVIIGGSSNRSAVEDTTFFQGSLDNALRTPSVAGVFDVLPRLVELFDHQVWLISKCGEWVQQRTLAWLEHHCFFDLTGIPAANVRFCRARPDKAIHCAELGISDLVDDRLDVHEAVRGIVARRYLFGWQPVPAPDWVIPAADWASLEDLIRQHLSRRDSPT